MNDAWLYVVSAVIFLVVFISTRRSFQARVLAQFLWSAVAAILLVGAAVVAVCKSEYAKAGREILLLLFVLIGTGFIPGLIIQWGEARRKKKFNRPRASADKKKDS